MVLLKVSIINWGGRMNPNELNEKPKFNAKPLLITIGIFIISVGAVGGLVYYAMNQQLQKDRESAQKTIQDLQKQIAEMKKASTTTSASTTMPSATNTTDATASWKTYTNTTYGFSFKYPADWVITEEAENYGDARKYLISFNRDESLESGNLYNVEVFNIGKSLAFSFVKSYFGGFESGPSAITTVSINNNSAVKFFMEKAGMRPSGSVNYLFSKNGTAVNFSNRKIGDQQTIMADETLQKIVNTFQFN